jgi:hypothetical protein
MFEWAHAWTAPSFYSTLGALILLVVVMPKAAANAGAAGVVVVWALLRFCQATAQIAISHRRLLDQKSRWPWIRDVIIAPMVVCSAVALISRLAIGSQPTLSYALVLIVPAGIVSALTSIIVVYRLGQRPRNVRVLWKALKMPSWTTLTWLSLLI